AVSDAQPLRAAERRINDSIAAGYLDGLNWFTTERAHRATHPDELLPGARSILILSASYLAQMAPPEPVPGRPRGRIARYAWGADYHDVLRDMARAVVEQMPAVVGRTVRSRTFVDSSPLAERAVAQGAGLGWFGKNSNILLPGAGSWSFLAAVVLDLDLEPDRPLRKTCGACTLCLEACPTHALPAAYVLDGPRCISFLTIELRAAIPIDLRSQMGTWVFGCDYCQEVCPVNRKAPTARIAALRPRTVDDAYPELLPLLALDDSSFRARYRGTPITRPKLWGFQRSVCVALGNAGDPAAIPVLRDVLAEDQRHPLVRGHAAWALGRLGGSEARRALTAGRHGPLDLAVQAEVTSALAKLEG
ncbi:MAG: tRNA epoxyqueuosine(34) reductase QueG, partial [Dehalococcoidia bacterium]|nr:tRNA epoxyqueuosine(34) reductase QueG [Dehalococcoidia bacterium]